MFSSFNSGRFVFRRRKTFSLCVGNSAPPPAKRCKLRSKFTTTKWKRKQDQNFSTIHFFPEKLSIAPKSPKSPQYGKQLGDIIKNLTLTSETLQNEKEQEMIKKTFDVYKRILLEAYCPRTMIIQRIGKQKMCSYYSLLSLYLLTHRTN